MAAGRAREASLLIAAKAGDDQTVQRLLLEDADPNKPDENGMTPLHWAAVGGREMAVRALLEFGAKINSRTLDGWTPLNLSVKAGHVLITRALLAIGADPNIPDRTGGRPLHHAAKNGFAVIVGMLLEQRADSNAGDSMGWTPLHWAAKNGFPVIVRDLLNSGACVSATETLNGTTALYWATREEHAEVADILLAAGGGVGADFTRVDEEQIEALYRALSRRPETLLIGMQFAENTEVAALPHAMTTVAQFLARHKSEPYFPKDLERFYLIVTACLNHLRAMPAPREDAVANGIALRIEDLELFREALNSLRSLQYFVALEIMRDPERALNHFEGEERLVLNLFELYGIERGALAADLRESEEEEDESSEEDSVSPRGPGLG